VNVRQLPPTADRLLWEMATRLASCHGAASDDPKRCGFPACGQRYPCLARRLADQVFIACERGWPHTWTIRLDLLSCCRSRVVSLGEDVGRTRGGRLPARGQGR
jgi:hypothetical protein